MSRYVIITAHITPPVPSNKFDWEAHWDSNEELGSCFGPTEEDAVMQLIEVKFHHVQEGDQR